MNHIGTVNIETRRLLLRRFVIEDALPMFKTWANDSDVTKYLTWLPHENVKVTKNILNTWIEGYKSPDSYNWAIVVKEQGKVVGSIAVVNIDKDNDKCEVGYCIGKDYWGREITTEALNEVLRYLLTTVGFNRVMAYFHSENIASGKVMQKAGMKFEGRLRDYAKNQKGVYVDCDVYAILKKDIV